MNNMKKQFFFIIPLIVVFACKKPAIPHTENTPPSIPWADSSSKHPMNNQFKELLEKYRQKGLPGISLLVNEKHGIWVGATGKADITKNVAYLPGHVSTIASITKLMVGTLAFKLIEDPVHSGLGYKWIPRKITDRVPNGNKITLGQCMKHETGVPDLIDENKFYLAVLNNPNKEWKAEELLEFIYDKLPDFNPGDTAVYSNTNTTLVSIVIEYATGKKHSDLLRQKIFTPAADGRHLLPAL